MATPTEEITLDIDALDAEAANKAANGAEKSEKTPDSEPITVQTVSPEPKTPEKQGISTEEGIEKLRQQLETERQRANDAERRANEAAQHEANARGEVQTSQLDLIKGAIERLTQSSDTLESQYADAMAAQDWKAAAKVQREMSGNAAKLAQLEAGKTALEKAPKPTPRAAADPVEQLCSQLSAPSATWVRAHPEFVRDNHKNRQMIAAHELAIAKGHKADSTEYFQSIEKTLDITPAVSKPDPKPNEDSDPMADAARPVSGAGRNVAPASAPVSRGGNGGGSKPNRVTLTSAEVEIAQAMGMTPEEYARNKVALKKEGKLS